MRIAILGGGGHGKVVIDIVEKVKNFELIGIIDSRHPIGEMILGYEVLGREENLSVLISQLKLEGIAIALGDNWLRFRSAETIRSTAPGIKFPNIAHPSAQIGKNVRIGNGNIIMAGVVVNSDTIFGDFCILNTNCSIDHDCKIGNLVSFAPNSSAGGAVEVENFSAVCLGANIIHKVKIGAHTVIGAGATVLSDIPDNSLAYGTPARKIRERTHGEKYL